ncbi:MAG: mechanosensitive ion channel family protein [Micavibrio sp.]
MGSLANMKIDFTAVDWAGLLSASSIITSIVFIFIIGTVRGLLIRYVRKDAEILDKDQRRWIIRIKNIAAVLIMFGLIMIWAPQLHTFAISIAAFAVALVVATKEMILCLTGAIMRATSQPFKVGEWVSIDGLTGEVVDLDAFSFRLQEVDMDGKTYQFTGRTVTVPNAKLFTHNVINANFFKSYIFEDVRVAVQYADIDPTEALNMLKEIASKYFAPYRENALAFNRKIRRRAGVDIGSGEPVFDLTTSELGHYQLHARLFLPTPLAAGVGSEISREFLARIFATRKSAALENKQEEEARMAQTPQAGPSATKAPPSG